MTEEPLSGRALLERIELARAVPLVSLLGVALLDEDDVARGAAFEVGGVALNGAGGAHSAAIAAALEFAAYLALAPSLSPHEHAVTHMASVSLIASVAEGDRVEVRGALLRRTRRVAFVTAEASTGGRVVATASFTKSVVPFG